MRLSCILYVEYKLESACCNTWGDKRQSEKVPVNGTPLVSDLTLISFFYQIASIQIRLY